MEVYNSEKHSILLQYLFLGGAFKGEGYILTHKTGLDVNVWQSQKRKLITKKDLGLNEYEGVSSSLA